MKMVYDTETFPNAFILCAEAADSGLTWAFEISPYKDESELLLAWLNETANAGDTLVGFNLLGFDGPILHRFMCMNGQRTPQQLYQHAQSIIEGEDRFSHLVKRGDRRHQWLDLYKIWHFDNFARATSLKTLEFNMRLKNISDLPYPVGSLLNQEQIHVLRKYCAHDVAATKQFYKESIPKIEFRKQLTIFGDLLNYSDVKLGKAIFQEQLENAGVVCYDYTPDKGRTPRQTKRGSIWLQCCIPNYINLYHPEFLRILDTFRATTITETKGAFKDMTAKVAGLDFVFGTGGIHASVENKTFEGDDEYAILDIDVTSMYPSIAIENKYYPAHLGPKFVEVYRQLKEKRVSYKKGTVENDALKLALNGVYGASNDKFSIFYDPLFTMQVTITGQLVMAMLVEKLLAIPGLLQIIQVNTDGITVHAPRTMLAQIGQACRDWENITMLTVEYTNYKKMCVADVNSYIAQTEDGKVKRKGRYEYDVDWHQDASALIVPKVAERVLLQGHSIMQTLRDWPDKMDFMLRAKIPRTSRLVYIDEHGEHQCQNIERYYMSKSGGSLTKIMPPLSKSPLEWRRIRIQSGHTVCLCSDLMDATMPVDYDWYCHEVEKLVLPLL